MLVVDDEINILKAVSRALVGLPDIAVETTTDPHSAIAILSDLPPRVLVVDFQMPGMDGVTLLREARRLSPDTVRMMLTGKADRKQVLDAINVGKVFRFVPKPWDGEALRAAVLEALEAHDTKRRGREALVGAHRERRSLRGAIERAGEIQISVLPSGPLHLDRAEVACSVTPREHATGDYVDVIPLSPNRTALLMGDVAGHGLGPALFVFTARALLRSGLADGGELSDVMDRTNRFLRGDMSSGRFLTLFAAIHDAQEEVLTYVNAGHNPPLLVQEGRVRELAATAAPLGLAEKTSYRRTEEVTLHGEDILFAYTDGLIEARSDQHESFGIARVIEHLEAHRACAPEELLARIREAVFAFVGPRGPQDDLTLLAYRLRGAPQAKVGCAPDAIGADS